MAAVSGAVPREGRAVRSAVSGAARGAPQPLSAERGGPVAAPDGR